MTTETTQTIDAAEFFARERLAWSETEFANQIIATAIPLGWLVKRDPPWRPTAAAAGYPDLTMVNGQRRRIIFAELKTQKGRISSAQHDWIDALDDACYESVERHNVSVVVWRPSDWDEIGAVLRGELCARCAYTERGKR